MKIKCPLLLFLLLFVSYRTHGMDSAPKFTDLPLEIIQEIFKFTEEKTTFCALRKTCRANRDYLEKLSNEVFLKLYVSSIKWESDKEKPLAYAIQYNDFYAVLRILKIKSINIDVNNARPLLWASRKGSLEIVKALLARNINVNKPDSDGKTPLYCAAFHGDVEIVKALLAKNADANLAYNKFGWTPLYWAVCQGYTSVVRLLLKANANVNQPINIGGLPINNAAYNGHTEIVKLLLKHNAHVNIPDEYGMTPLSWAVRKGHTEIIKLLKEHGAKK